MVRRLALPALPLSWYGLVWLGGGQGLAWGGWGRVGGGAARGHTLNPIT